jgi:hypothetical protein
VFVRPPLRMFTIRSYSKAPNNRDELYKKGNFNKFGENRPIDSALTVERYIYLVCVELEVGPVVTKLPTLHQVR